MTTNGEPSMNVEGTLSPVVNGNFPWWQHIGTKDSWRHEVLGFDIWWHVGDSVWYLADTYPDAPAGGDDFWVRDDPSPHGDYTPGGTATGVAWCFFIHPKSSDHRTWEYWGMAETWLVRSAWEKQLHGQAFYPRTVWPPDYIGASYPIYPLPWRVVSLPDSWYCCWKPSEKLFTFYEHWDTPPVWRYNTGISIFQIQPDKAERTWEKRFTRIIAWASPWPTGETECILHANLHRPPPAGVQVRYFARVWDNVSFRHIEPAYSSVCEKGSYVVTGNPNPDCTGLYLWGGQTFAHDYFVRFDGKYFMWEHPVNEWFYITTELQDIPNGLWSKGKPMAGTYNPGPPYTGNPVATYFPPENP